LSTAGVWSSAYVASSGDVWPTGVTLSSSGVIHLGGSQVGSATHLGSSQTSAGLGDAFAIRISSNGSLGWVRLFGNSGQTYVVRIAAGRGGGLVVNFDNGGSGTVTLGSTTQQLNDLDSMIVHLPPSGELP
jgi:hypothetical protein